MFPHIAASAEARWALRQTYADVAVEHFGVTPWRNADDALRAMSRRPMRVPDGCSGAANGIGPINGSRAFSRPTLDFRTRHAALAPHGLRARRRGLRVTIVRHMATRRRRNRGFPGRATMSTFSSPTAGVADQQPDDDGGRAMSTPSPAKGPSTRQRREGPVQQPSFRTRGADRVNSNWRDLAQTV